MSYPRIQLLIISLLFCCSGTVLSQDTEELLKLTFEEKQFLAEHSTVRAHNSATWVPFNFNRNGIPQGYSIDYLNLLAEKLNIQIEYETGYSWNEYIDMMKRRELDLMINMTLTSDRKQFAVFTEPVITYPPAIISRTQEPYRSLDQLQGKSVAIVEGYWYQQVLEHSFPDIELLLVDDQREALAAVSFSQAEASIGNGAVSQHIWLDSSLPNLSLTGEAELQAIEKYYERIGVRKDWPLLRSALDKAIKAVSYEEKKFLEEKWLIQDRQQEGMVLTEQEYQFINDHPVIRVHNEKSWLPYNFFRDGTPQGYTIDLFELLSEKSGLQFEYVTGPTWDEFLLLLKEKEIDVMGNMIKTDERSEYTLFTKEVASAYPAIASHFHKPYYSLEELKEKTVAVVKGFWQEEMLSENYPALNLLLVNSTQDALRAVSFGKADAAIGAGPVLLHQILENNLGTVEVTGNIEIAGINDYQQRIGVRDDWPVLRQILNKALDAITYNEKRHLREKWLSRHDEELENRVVLEDIEKAFLNKHKVIRVHNEMEWPPFNYNEEGIAKGFSIDFMDLLAKKTGFTVEYVSGPSWDEFLQQLRGHELDVMLNVVKTPEREKYMLFTDTYVTNPNVIISSRNENYQSIESLKNKVVAIPKGFFYEELMSRSYPEVKQLSVRNLSEAMKMVIFNKADAALGELAVVEYLIQKNMFNNLQVSGEVDLGGLKTENLHIGVRDDWPIFQKILMKAMEAVSPREVREMRRRWLMFEAGDEQVKVDLSAEEKMYLNGKGVIRMCVDPSWMPYEQIDSHGNHVGMSADFFTWFSERLETEIKLYSTSSWAETIEAAENRKCDIISMAISNGPRRQFMNFTTPYIKLPVGVVTTLDKPFVEDLEQLSNQTLTVLKDYSITEELQRDYPQIRLREVDSFEEGLALVRGGKVYGHLDATATIGYKIRHSEIIDLKISAIVQSDDFGMSVGIRNDEPLLTTVFQKVVNTLTEEDIQRVYNRWVAVKVEPKVDYTVLWKIILVLLVVTLGVIFWSWRLTKEKKRTRQALDELNRTRRQLEERNFTLRKLVNTDHLTGLLNRKKIEKVILREIIRAKRYKNSFGVILMDVDLFKEVNDTHGHAVGDEVLLCFTEILTQHSRDTDTVGRWGGEEFIIVCPETDEAGAVKVAEKLRQVIAEYPFPAVINKTASFGVTVYEQGDDIDTLLLHADKALYQAKEHGRNTVVLFEKG